VKINMAATNYLYTLIKHFDRDYIGEFKPETVRYQDVRFELTNSRTVVAQNYELA